MFNACGVHHVQYGPVCSNFTQVLCRCVVWQSATHGPDLQQKSSAGTPSTYDVTGRVAKTLRQPLVLLL